jgi:hypothetical protein
MTPNTDKAKAGPVLSLDPLCWDLLNFLDRSFDLKKRFG